MKKIFLVVLVCSLFLLTGCGNEDEKIICSIKDNIDSTKAKIENKYTISYSGNYVTKLHSEEIVIVEDKKVLKDYKKALDTEFSKYSDIDYYTNKNVIRGNKLISTTDINYSKVDTNKLLEVDETNESYIVDGKVKVDTVKATYISMGATCK